VLTIRCFWHFDEMMSVVAGMYFAMCQTVGLGDVEKLDGVQVKLGGVHGAAKNDSSCGAHNNKKVKRRISEPVHKPGVRRIETIPL